MSFARIEGWMSHKKGVCFFYNKYNGTEEKNNPENTQRNNLKLKYDTPFNHTVTKYIVNIFYYNR